MNPKPLSTNLTDALHAAGDESLLHRKNVEAIRRGVESMEAGKGMSIDESQRLIEEAIHRSC